MRAVLVVLLLLLAQLAEYDAGDLSEESADDADTDDDSDSAPFMIMVEHDATPGAEAAWRCSGSLVSIRTGVTSAECARGLRDKPTRDLWVLAAATIAGVAPRTDGARRVSRVATAGKRQHEASSQGGAWTGALLDLAVLELEKPFGSGARARPILMATAPQECASGGVCHVVRALARANTKHMRLRIVDAMLANDNTCAQVVRYWAALRERALCLTGPELCQSEWGAGVVCGGKLCGVVSRSAVAATTTAAALTTGPTLVPHDAATPECGDTHAAQSVARWRRFLHCAHTLRACGRGSCSDLCTEQQLLEEPDSKGEGDGDSGAESAEAVSPSSPGPTSSAALFSFTPAALRPTHHVPPPVDLAHIAPPEDMPLSPTLMVQPTRVHASPATRHTSQPSPPVVHLSYGRKPTRTTGTNAQRGRPTRPGGVKMPGGSSSSPSGKQQPSLSKGSSSGPVRPTPLFEPNRPDFRAGEYGDNAAEYGAPGEEGGGGAGGGTSPAWVYASPGAAGPHTPALNASARRRLPAVQSRKADRVFNPEREVRPVAKSVASTICFYFWMSVFFVCFLL